MSKTEGTSETNDQFSSHKNIREEYEKANGLTVDSSDMESAKSEDAVVVTDEVTVQPKAETEAPADTKDAPEADEQAEGDAASKQENKQTKEDEKLVPLPALQEARQKVKAKTLENRELKEQLAQVKAELEKVKSQNSRVDEDSDQSDMSEREKKLAERLSEVEAQLNTHTKKQSTASQEEAQKTLQTQISTTAAELESAGYPGFDLFTQAVHAELVRMVKEGEGEPEELDTPENWKKVYQEVVFPKVKQKFEVVKKRDVLSDKQSAKKSANLTATPGTKVEESQKPKEDDWSRDDYFAARQKATKR